MPVPVLQQSPAIESAGDVSEFAAEIGFPLFVKAAAGGGRGLRRVEHQHELSDAVGSAVREAESAFGDPIVFLEEAVTDVRHIEVQVLGDSAGEVVHLYERDCSVPRRFQKVVEIALAPRLDPNLRSSLCDDAVRFATSIDYLNAGTVEFLVDPSSGRVFIEINPRIQVGHTVTEEVTDIDLVESQLLISGGSTLEDLGIAQEGIFTSGFAVQCHIAAEDPSNDFRLDDGTGFVALQPTWISYSPCW